MLIRPLREDDRDGWLSLWRGYTGFYAFEPSEAVTATLWRRLQDPAEPMHALVAEAADGSLIGLTHYLFHRNTWMIEPVCYLQDLFTAEAARGRGAARGLIAAVAEAARQAGSPRLYWMTHESNATARALYDKVAQNSGFIQYRIPLA